VLERLADTATNGEGVADTGAGAQEESVK